MLKVLDFACFNQSHDVSLWYESSNLTLISSPNNQKYYLKIHQPGHVVKNYFDLDTQWIQWIQR